MHNTSLALRGINQRDDEISQLLPARPVASFGQPAWLKAKIPIHIGPVRCPRRRKVTCLDLVRERDEQQIEGL
jgi:hypothetical protein